MSQLAIVATQDGLEDALLRRSGPRQNLIVFRNKGEIDVRGITTFGISAKDEDNGSPIGYFGTGLKYAIAVLLREGLNITIQAGETVYRFGVSDEEMRGKSFKIVTMNGQPLGFTTELGKNWQLWQAFRELYSNTIDEFGSVDTESEAPDPAANRTQIFVEGDSFVEMYENRSQIFIQGDPLIETKHANVHGGVSQFLFYRGIRVHSSQKPFLYRYNFKRQTDLTEDRTLKYYHQIEDTIVDTVLASHDEMFIESILLAPEHVFEHGIDFTDNREAMTPEFKNVVSRLARLRPEQMNKKAKELFERDLKPEHRFSVYKPTEEETAALIEAIDFLAKINVCIDKFVIVNVVTLGAVTLAMVQDKKIYLSSRLYKMGVKQLASTLFEEWVHLTLGYQDMTRTMQTYLFDTIIGLGEKLTGDVL